MLGELIPAKLVKDELVKHVANDTGRNENKRGFRKQGCNRNSANPCGWCSKSSGKHTHRHILFLINFTYKYITRMPSACSPRMGRPRGWNPGTGRCGVLLRHRPGVLPMGYMGREPIAVISAFPAGYHALRGTVPGNGLSNDSQPMSYTIGTAARATGKAKSTISRDVKSGRISAQK